VAWPHQGELVSAAWSATEVASALGIKQRLGQMDAPQAQAAPRWFARWVTHDLALLPMAATTFHRAAAFAFDAANALRAGDALHLACAEQAGGCRSATAVHRVPAPARLRRL
jgi:hypothetical protein